MIRVFICFLLAAFPAAAFEEMPLPVAVTRPTTSPVAVLEMLQRGEKANSVDQDGMTPLMLAAKYAENPKIIDVLVSHGADVNRRNIFTGQTALFYAARYNKNPEIPRSLIRYGSSIWAVDLRGRTIKQMLSENPVLQPDILDDYLFDEDVSPSVSAPAASSASR